MKACWCFCLFLFMALSSEAQVLEKMISKIHSYQHISYVDILQFQWSFDAKAATDTNKVFISRTSPDPDIQSYYKVISGDGLTYSYAGNKLVVLDNSDSTYKLFDGPEFGQVTHILPYFARQVEHNIRIPGKIKQLKDSSINGSMCYHLKMMTKDTIENNHRSFIKFDFFINQKSFLPVSIVITQLGADEAGTVLGLTEEHQFKNYQFNPAHFPDLASNRIPANYKTRVPKHVDVLANGTKAPEIKLYDLQGKKWSFDNLKNKTVLLSFDYVGCPHCIDAEQVLKKLSAKYLDTAVLIAIIYPIDSAEAVMKHNKISEIQMPSYITDRSAAKAYPFGGYPAFYVINKKGNVAGSYVGFSDDLQAQLSALIDSDK